MIALLRNDEVVAGAMSMPVVNEIYWAASGQGCWLNGARCRVSTINNWNEANLTLGRLGRPVESPVGDHGTSLRPSGAYTIGERDPGGRRLELATSKLEPPAGCTQAEVLRRAHDWRVARGVINIQDEDLADDIEAIIAERGLSLNEG